MDEVPLCVAEKRWRTPEWCARAGGVSLEGVQVEEIEVEGEIEVEEIAAIEEEKEVEEETDVEME